MHQPGYPEADVNVTLEQGLITLMVLDKPGGHVIEEVSFKASDLVYAGVSNSDSPNFFTSDGLKHTLHSVHPGKSWAVVVALDAVLSDTLLSNHFFFANGVSLFNQSLVSSIKLDPLSCSVTFAFRTSPIITVGPTFDNLGTAIKMSSSAREGWLAYLKGSTPNGSTPNNGKRTRTDKE